MNKAKSAEDWVSPKIEIRKSPVGGSGMFAVSPIKEGEKVVIWGGKYVDSTKAKEELKDGKVVIQWDEDLFSVEDKGEDIGYFVNHSCEPNAWMSDAFTLVARRDIETGDEVSADYAMWEANEDYIAAWDCNCGSRLCRKKIKGTDWKSQTLQENYKEHFSPLLNKRIEKENNPSVE